MQSLVSTCVSAVGLQGMGWTSPRAGCKTGRPSVAGPRLRRNWLLGPHRPRAPSPGNGPPPPSLETGAAGVEATGSVPAGGRLSGLSASLPPGSLRPLLNYGGPTARPRNPSPSTLKSEEFPGLPAAQLGTQSAPAHHLRGRAGDTTRSPGPAERSRDPGKRDQPPGLVARGSPDPTGELDVPG